jgi:hypothetical protein
MAASTDGLTFVAQDSALLEQASVPDGIVFGGKLMFYYVSGGQEHGMFSALLGDGGWQRGDKVMLDGQFNPNAVDSDVVVLPDGRVRLFYNGNGGIESMRSNDGGVTWEVEPGFHLQ